MTKLYYLPLLATLFMACSPAAPATPAKRTVMPEETQPDIQTEEITYQANGTTLKGYMAWDANREGERPGVLVVHEWWGHNDYVRTRARMLAELGYTAFALDMYGDGKNTTHPKDAQAFVTEVVSNMDNATSRFKAALDVLQKHPTTDASRIAAIGYCFGGSVALHMARVGLPLQGVVSFHGNLATRTPAKPGIKAKMLVLTGGADPMVPKEQVEAFKKEMTDAGADFEVVSYDGALHAFTNPAATELGKESELPLAYDAHADQDSWVRMVAFLSESF